MSIARKLELVGSVFMGLLAVGILVTGIKEEYHVSVYLNRPPDMISVVVGSIIVFLCPCLVVAYGSFLHAVKQQNSGKVLLIIGCSFIIGYFCLAFFSLALLAILKSPLLLLLWGMAVFTLIISFIVERQNKRAFSSL